ncbi:unnamed protein product [Mytilus edulis]|uniref:MACPF domain-containing protein n=1 Tax=Mytilus edulis TaxID=6550 RepID=A0A8S3Q2V8_MYTED|nr:unnamed protein product [Mytilus edulis]
MAERISENVNKEETREKEKRDEREWLSLPTSGLELTKLRMMGKSHPSMKMAYKSIRISRAPNRAFILLIGETGGGKSSTINYLLNTDIAPINKSESQRHSTTEYVLTMKSDEWRIPDLTMSIIDTPGFLDTGGFDQDVRNLGSIKSFCNKHPYLRNNYPNLVFVVQKITENRMMGSDSRFSNLLRAFSKIDVVDKRNHNLVVILTHAAMLPRKKDKWEAMVHDQMNIISSVVISHFGITPKIVVQENLPDDYGLPEDGDWHILPNGERQPLQMFLTCKELLNLIQDELCHEALSVCFRPGEKNLPEIGLVVSPDNVKSSIIRKLQGALLDPLIPTEDTEVANLLQAYKVNKNIATVDKEIPKLILRLRSLNINDVFELQSLSMNQLKVRFDNIPITGVMEKVLEDVFGMQYENISSLNCPVGKGFNIFSDCETVKTPIKLDRGSMGMLGLPGNVTVQKCNFFDINCQVVEDYAHYIEQRLRNFNLNIGGNLNVGMFRMQLRGGYNKNSSTSSKSLHSLSEITFAVEQRMYKVTIEDVKIEVVDEFALDVQNLPDKYEENDDDKVEKWNMFCEKWGHYVITGMYLGGSVSGAIQVKDQESISKEENCQNILAKLAAHLSSLQGNSDLNYKSSSLFESTKAACMKSLSIQWNGGSYVPKAVAIENVDTVEWERWQETLEFAPSSLTTHLDLCPVYLIAERVNKEKSIEIKKAFESDLFLKRQSKSFTTNFIQFYNRRFLERLLIPPDSYCNRNAVAESNPNGGCFHESSSVLLSNKTRKQMKDVAVGDKIITLNRKLQAVNDTVITWIHKVPNGKYAFLQIVHGYGSLIVSKEHIVYVGTKCTPILASEVCCGDIITVLKQDNDELLQCVSTVQSVQEVKMTGLYAPLTKSGNLVVDGVAVSCYCKMKSVSIQVIYFDQLS